MASPGYLAENILYFARLLRAAGLPLGTGQVLLATEAVATLGIESREDLYWCLFAQFLTKHSQRDLYDQAFHLFWRNPRIRERLIGELLPRVDSGKDSELSKLSRRLNEALGTKEAPALEREQKEIDIDARFSSSPQEVLQEKDFEQMSAEEIAAARQFLARLRLPAPLVATRRFERSHRSERIDLRASMSASLRNSDIITLQFKRRRQRPPPLVILVDISGSMEQYSRMFLHFMHAVSNDRDRIHSFVFGTRLTNITRHLRHRDVDFALARAGTEVRDWAGGTRIGACLETFNRRWSRRVLGQGAVVLLVSDGLERDANSGLEQQMERLHKSCRRLVWLNPLLRFEQFEPRAAGIRAMLPHSDEFRAAHNINSLLALAGALEEGGHGPGAYRRPPSIVVQSKNQHRGGDTRNLAT